MNKNECCGCTACAANCPNKCITMQTDREGFLYPTIDSEQCIQCGLCEKVCPINRERKVKSDEEIKVFACINRYEEERLSSSSGGVFPLLAKSVLTNKGKVYGAAFDEKWSVCHIGVDNVNCLQKLQGSKYLQSDKRDVYNRVKEDLQAGKEVLFSGTPCEISGLKSFLGKDYEKLICVDVVCHGVPSPMVWQKYLSYLEKLVNKPFDRESTPSHRSKVDGWSRYSVSIPFSHDTEYRKEHEKDLYMKTFLKDVILRPSCYACKFKPSTDVSDISLADFWGIQEVLPQFFDDKGTSLVIINSSKGKKYFDEIKDKLKYQEVSYEIAVKYNPAIISSAKKPGSREYFFDFCDKMDLGKLMKRVTRENAKNLMKRNIVICIDKLGLRWLIDLIRGRKTY